MSIIAAYLAKLLKDRRLFSRRNADTGISDRDLRAIVCLVGRDSDSPSLGGELHGIRQKIEKNLFDLTLTANIFPKPLIYIYIQVNPVLDSARAHKCPCVVDSQR